MPTPRVPILELEAELAHAVPEAQRAVATRYATAPVIVLPPGDWAPRDQGAADDGLGLLVIDGVLTRSLELRGRTTSELLGEGDLLRPRDHGPREGEVALNWWWTVLQPTRVALLDARFSQVAARWPGLVEALLARALRRSRALAFQLSLAQVTRVEERIVLLLWFLADRWGRVGPDGVLVPIRLTHETLALLVGARRPTVTTALGELSRSGRVTRHEQGWLLGRPLSDG